MTDPRLDPLVQALLPVALHKLGNATQLLTGLNAMLGFEEGQALLAERSEDLTRAGETIEQVGWLLGALGSASGDQLLQARRAPEGLTWMIGLVAEALRRDKLPLMPAKDLPLLTPGALDGWQVPWGIARLLHAARLDRAEDSEPMAWSLAQSAAGRRLDLEGGAHLCAAAEQVAARLQGATLDLTGSSNVARLGLELPGEWFQ